MSGELLVLSSTSNIAGGGGVDILLFYDAVLEGWKLILITQLCIYTISKCLPQPIEVHNGYFTTNINIMTLVIHY